MSSRDPLAGYTSDWKLRITKPDAEDDPLAQYTPGWRESAVSEPEFDVGAAQREMMAQGRDRIEAGTASAERGTVTGVPQAGVGQLLAQFSAAAAEATLNTAAGIGELAAASTRIPEPDDLPIDMRPLRPMPERNRFREAAEQFAENRREDARLVNVAIPAETTGEKIARGASRVIAEVAQFAVPGMVGAKAPAIAKLPALQRFGAQLALDAPVDAAIGAGSEEYSTAGALGKLTDSDWLRSVASDPAKRAAFEVATGTTAASVLTGAVKLTGAALRRAQAAIDARSARTPLPEPVDVPARTEAVPEPLPGLPEISTMVEKTDAQLLLEQRAASAGGTEPTGSLVNDILPDSYQRIDDPAELRRRAASGDQVAQAQLRVQQRGPVAGGIAEPDITTKPVRPNRRSSARATEVDSETLLGDMRALTKALPAAEADGSMRVIEVHASGDPSEVADVLRQSSDRVFRIGDNEYVILASAEQADVIARTVTGRGMRVGVGNTAKEADAAIRSDVRVADDGGPVEVEVDTDTFADEAPEIVASGRTAQPGFVAPRLLAQIGSGVVGAGVGAAIDDENRLRGAAIMGAASVGLGSVAARRAARTPKALSPAQKAVLATVNRGDGPNVLQKLSKASTGAPRAIRRGYQKVFDETFALGRFGQEVGKSPALKHEAKRALAYRSAAEARVLDEFAPVIEASRGIEDEVIALAKAQRALELVDAGMPEKGVDLKVAKEVVETASPEAQNAARLLRDYYASLIDYKVENGVLTPERGQAILESGKVYTPFIPEDAPRGGQTGGMAGRFVNRTPGVRRMSGWKFEGRTVDPFRQAILDTIETERRVAKQRVSNMVGRLALELPQESQAFIRELPTKTQQRAEMVDRLVASGTDPKRAHAIVADMDFGETKAYKGREVGAIVDGEQRRFEVLDDALYESWAAMNTQTQNIAIRTASAFARLMRAGVVNNPAFGLANFIRDQAFSIGQYPIPKARAATGAVTGAIVGGASDEDDPIGGALKGAAIGGAGGAFSAQLARTLSAMNDILGREAVGGVVGAVTGAFAGPGEDVGDTAWNAAIGALIGMGGGRAAKSLGLFEGNPEVYREWIRHGGSSGGYFARDNRGAGAILRELRKTPGFEPEDLIRPTSWWDTMQRINRGIEEATRLARYKHLLAAGMDAPEAVVGSRDISVDFLQRGSSSTVRALGQMKAFLNPQLQGWSKVVRMLNPMTTEGRKTAAVFGATLTAPSIALWAINKDNPEYWERPQWERNLFWLIPKSDGGFARIMKPFEPGFIFASLPERILDFAYQQDPERLRYALGDMLSTTFGEVVPFIPKPGGGVTTGPIPTALEPAQEAFMSGPRGWDNFRNRPILSFGDEQLMGDAQYDEHTSTIAVRLAELLPGQQSPEKIDHMLRGHTGTLGSQALDMISEAARASGLDDRPAPPDRPNFLTGRFATRSDIVSDDEMFVRRRYERAEQVYQTAKAHMDRGEQDAAVRVVNENLDVLSELEGLRTQKQLLDQATKARREVRRSRMASEDKNDLLETINHTVAGLLRGKADAVAAPAGNQN